VSIEELPLPAIVGCLKLSVFLALGCGLRKFFICVQP